jgi:hypothetical protein
MASIEGHDGRFLFCRRPLAHDETDEGDNDEYDKQHIGDVGRRTRHPRDPQEPRDQPNDEKGNGPVKHDSTSIQPM